MSDVMYRKWPSEQNKAVILLVHGLGAHSDRWIFLSDFLCKNGFTSYAIELKGFGATEGERGHIDSFKTYYDDLLLLLDKINKENRGKKIFLLGESMGGLIAFRLAQLYPEAISGLIAISPAFANGMKFGFKDYATLLTSMIINPKKTLNMPFTSEMCTRDKTYQVVMNNNPKEIRVASAKLLLNILIEQIKSKASLNRMKTPVLFLLAGIDYLVDERENKKVFNNISYCDKTLIEYPEMLHALSIELDREKVFADILSWLTERT